MKPAEERLTPELHALEVRSPRVPVVADVDGNLKRDGRSAIEALVAQITAPVRWEDGARRLASEGVTTYVEVDAGTVLTGLGRKIDREANAVNFGTPDDLVQVEALLGAPTND
jgi:[acyl-carrier-protein] S-malonyltransferase